MGRGILPPDLRRNLRPPQAEEHVDLGQAEDDDDCPASRHHPQEHQHPPTPANHAVKGQSHPASVH